MANNTTISLTRIETVEVYLPGFSEPFYTMEARPVFKGIWKNDWFKVFYENSENGDTIRWYESGDVDMVKTNGSVKKWYPRPVLSDVILMRPNMGVFTQFNSSGEVAQTLNNISWYWGINNIEIEALPITEIEYIESLDHCGCYNDYRCCGWYPPEDDR